MAIAARLSTTTALFALTLIANLSYARSAPSLLDGLLPQLAEKLGSFEAPSSSEVQETNNEAFGRLAQVVEQVKVSGGPKTQILVKEYAALLGDFKKASSLGAEQRRRQMQILFKKMQVLLAGIHATLARSEGEQRAVLARLADATQMDLLQQAWLADASLSQKVSDLLKVLAKDAGLDPTKLSVAELDSIKKKIREFFSGSNTFESVESARAHLAGLLSSELSGVSKEQMVAALAQVDSSWGDGSSPSLLEHYSNDSQLFSEANSKSDRLQNEELFARAKSKPAGDFVDEGVTRSGESGAYNGVLTENSQSALNAETLVPRFDSNTSSLIPVDPAHVGTKGLIEAPRPAAPAPVSPAPAPLPAQVASSSDTTHLEAPAIPTANGPLLAPVLTAASAPSSKGTDYWTNFLGATMSAGRALVANGVELAGSALANIQESQKAVEVDPKLSSGVPIPAALADSKHSGDDTSVKSVLADKKPNIRTTADAPKPVSGDLIPLIAKPAAAIPNAPSAKAESECQGVFSRNGTAQLKDSEIRKQIDDHVAEVLAGGSQQGQRFSDKELETFSDSLRNACFPDTDWKLSEPNRQNIRDNFKTSSAQFGLVNSLFTHADAGCNSRKLDNGACAEFQGNFENPSGLDRIRASALMTFFDGAANFKEPFAQNPLAASPTFSHGFFMLLGEAEMAKGLNSKQQGVRHNLTECLEASNDKKGWGAYIVELARQMAPFAKRCNAPSFSSASTSQPKPAWSDLAINKNGELLRAINGVSCPPPAERASPPKGLVRLSKEEQELLKSAGLLSEFHGHQSLTPKDCASIIKRQSFIVGIIKYSPKLEDAYNRGSDSTESQRGDSSHER